MASWAGFGPRAVVWRPLLYTIGSEMQILKRRSGHPK